MPQMVNNLPAMQDTWVHFLSWEDPLKEGMATHSSILAWRIPWTEEPCMVTYEKRTKLSEISHQAYEDPGKCRCKENGAGIGFLVQGQISRPMHTGQSEGRKSGERGG